METEIIYLVIGLIVGGLLGAGGIILYKQKKTDIDLAIQQFETDNADSLISGSKFEDFLFWEDKGNTLEAVNYNPNNRGRRQDRNLQFVENGSIYIFRTSFINKNITYNKKSFSYVMPKERSVDIDDIDDLKNARSLIYKKFKK